MKDVCIGNSAAGRDCAGRRSPEGAAGEVFNGARVIHKWGYRVACCRMPGITGFGGHAEVGEAQCGSCCLLLFCRFGSLAASCHPYLQQQGVNGQDEQEQQSESCGWTHSGFSRRLRV
ncbi:MAG: hypothetical protein H8E41_12905 [Desulfobulbaceae bacterium]|uniref:Uncharacterized protein n=1 Tax=Candidatus Desulfobia pelagia TaxID=2841692 RepID=A0A8J6NDY7_9BACT|nr:hypothetical protein [Candidatus Desulfobia pelagia]